MQGNQIYHKEIVKKTSPLTQNLNKIGEEHDPRFGKICIFQNRQSGENLMMKQKDSYEISDCQRDIFQAKERLKINMDSLFKFHDYTTEEREQDGELAFRVCGYYEYPTSDLRQDFAKRARENRNYTTVELEQLLFNIADALAYLQKNKMIHGDIRPKYISYFQKDQRFKLMDRLGDPSPPHQVQLNNFRSGDKIYMSPILFMNLSQGNNKFRHNPYKSDAFSLGLIILEAGLLQSINDIYNQDGH